MLSYRPGETVAHRLDPRSKLWFQAGFAVAVFAHPQLPGLAAATALALFALAAARLSPLRALWAYRVVLVVLALVPLLGGLVPGPPWFRAEAAADSLRMVLRLVPILLVSAAFVHSTPVRETRAAIQRTVPGRFGRLLAVGVSLTFRFVPVVRTDVTRSSTAVAARGGNGRSLRDRARRIVALSAARSVRRADRLSLALQARCLAYDPTLPTLSFRPADYAVLALSVLLALVGLVPTVRSLVGG